MNVNHQISDFVANLNFAIMTRKKYVDIRFSFLIWSILKIIRDNGCIKGFTLLENNIVRVFFRYIDNKSILKNILVMSKPSKRIYWKINSLYLNSFNLKLNGFYIISTNLGLYTSSEILFLNKFVSGEILLFVEI